MGFSYTEQQRKVIDTRNKNLLVSAAAGSGKTAVLVERIVSLVCDRQHPVDIDRLLVVTFTNAAAAQMRERISIALSERLNAEPDNGHLQRQAALLHNAQITTIDSFCLFVIRNNFNDIGLDPAFRVADEGELKLLSAAVMEELMEECFEGEDPEFIRCVEGLNSAGDEKTLAEYIVRLHEFAGSYPFPEEWLERAAWDYQGEGWKQFVLGDTGLLLTGCVGMYEKALALCRQPEGPYMYEALLEEEKEGLERLSGCHTFEEYEKGLSGFSFGRLSSKKDEDVSLKKREQVKAMRTQVKDTVEKIKSRYFFAGGETLKADMDASSGMIRMLVRLTLEYGRRLQEKKREKNIIDFGDMEHYALAVLLEKTENGYVPTKAARDYRKHFQEILVDEYQDSNLVQEYLLQSISRQEEGAFNRFMVGDVKQSIYRFRLARPEIFLEKLGTYQKDGEKEEKIILSQNFRSRREVTDSVNHVFEKIMKKELGGVDYDQEAYLYPAASFPPYGQGDAELILLESGEKGGESKVRREARLVAGRIRQLVRDHQVTDEETGTLRKACFKDIVVLLRSSAGWDGEFEEIFRAYGIPACVSSSTGYFSAEEVRVMLNVLRVLDNPLQDIPLYGVLISPVGKFTEKELAWIRAEHPEGYLYEALLQHQGAHREKAGVFLDFLTRYRKRASLITVSRLLREILQETEFTRYVTASSEGDVKRANLDMLLKKAEDFEKTGSYGLFSFIRYMEQMENYDVDYGTAGVYDENANAVRIMTIHKSKGLEFPICIVAGLAKQFNRKDQTKAVLMDVDMGLGCEYADPGLRLKRTTIKRNALARKQQMESLGEEIRVLYVAMTRAKEKLIMTACVEDAEKKLNLPEQAGQGESLSYLTLSRAGSLLDFLLPVWEQVRVVATGETEAKAVWETLRGSLQRQRLEDYTREPYQKEWKEMIEERFSFVYPWDLSGLYTKTTVSELKFERMDKEEETALPLFDTERKEAYIPRFRGEEKQMSGSSIGSAFHRVMELMDFKEIPEGSDLKAVTDWVDKGMERELSKGRLEKEEKESVSSERIARFLLCPVAMRMKKSAIRGELRKEQPFMLGVPGDRVKDTFPQEETVLIQGIIDVYWEEEDGLVVADYKTDRVSCAEELVKRYQAQLDYYGEALEQITGKKVKEKLIYSFHLNQIIFL